MKLFHKSLIISQIPWLGMLIFGCCGICAPAAAQASEPLPYAQYYDPAKGFKQAQADFTAVFLQLAGSLEHHGTPEPYIRHILAEHTRIAAKYKAATGKNNNSRPAYLTDEYVENLLANWRKLDEGLKLNSLCRKSGRNMRLAIMGSWNMPISELLAEEQSLTPKQLAAYRQLLGKPFFKKSDFADLESFYATGGGWEKLSANGKAQISKRVSLGTKPEAERNAIIENNKNGSLVVKLLNAHHKELMSY